MHFSCRMMLYDSTGHWDKNTSVHIIVPTMIASGKQYPTHTHTHCCAGNAGIAQFIKTVCKTTLSTFRIKAKNGLKRSIFTHLPLWDRNWEEKQVQECVSSFFICHKGQLRMHRRNISQDFRIKVVFACFYPYALGPAWKRDLMVEKQKSISQIQTIRTIRNSSALIFSLLKKKKFCSL